MELSEIGEEFLHTIEITEFTRNNWNYVEFTRILLEFIGKKIKWHVLPTLIRSFSQTYNFAADRVVNHRYN